MSSTGEMPAPPQQRRWKFQLFIAAGSPRGERALADTREFIGMMQGCACELEVVDIKSNSQAAMAANVLATPTLLLLEPPMGRRVVGELVNKPAALRWFGYHAPQAQPEPPAPAAAGAPAGGPFASALAALGAADPTGRAMGSSVIDMRILGAERAEPSSHAEFG